MAATGFEGVRAVADAILYEGYLLYPYRRSSGKNRVRWQFGVLAPRSWADAHGLDDTSVAGSAESWWQQTECLLEAADDAAITCRLRFLQLQRRTVHRRRADGTFEEVDALGPDVPFDLPFDEAVPREFDVAAPLAELVAGERRFTVRAPAGTEHENVAGGRITRRRRDVDAVVALSAFRCDTPFPLHRLRIRVENGHGGDRAAAPRDEALCWSLLAAHTMIAAVDGEFVSLLDPPQWAEQAARECANVHTFPVLAGPEGARGLVLSSPILLYDHPRIAPESPGDLHDAAEIDEILSLRTMTLTDAEKREARATDPRAAEILDRVDGMPDEVLSRLHGAVRSIGPLREPAKAEEPDRTPWWDPGADESVSPDTDSVVVDGVAVARGSRVRLRPRTRGTDPQDRFLDGRTALVEAVLLDVDDACHLAVSLEDDPAAEMNQWYGRFRYFAPDEVEPLANEPRIDDRSVT